MVDGMIDNFVLGDGVPRENSIQVKENSNQFNFCLLTLPQVSLIVDWIGLWPTEKLKVPVAIIVDVLFDVLMFILTFLIINCCCLLSGFSLLFE